MGSGCLLPTSHQPYETAAPLERSAPCPPSPLHNTNRPSQDATPAHSPTRASTAHSGDIDDLFRDQRVQPTSENDSKVHGYPVPSVEAPLSRTFIDSPFCSRRPALRELPFVAPAGVAWGAASPDTAAAWTTEDNRQPFFFSESRGRWGDRSQAENHFASSLAVGGVSARSGGGETRQRSGLDLSGTRDVEPPADPLSRDFFRETPSFGARGQEAPWPLPPGLESKEGDRSGCIADWQAEHTMGVLDRATATENPLISDTGWGQPDERVWRQPVWGDSGGGEEGIDVRYAEGQKYETYHVQERLALRGARGVQANAEHACEVGPTYPKACTLCVILHSVLGVWLGQSETSLTFKVYKLQSPAVPSCDLPIPGGHKARWWCIGLDRRTSRSRSSQVCTCFCATFSKHAGDW